MIGLPFSQDRKLTRGQIADIVISTSFDLASYTPQVPKGQKRQKENWENMWYLGLFGGMAFAGVVLMYKPDTRYVSTPRHTLTAM